MRTAATGMRYLLVVLGLALALGACADTEAGTPTATPPAPDASAGSGGAAGVFGTIYACDLLNQALSGQGYPPGVKSTAGGPNGCQAKKTGVAAHLDLVDTAGIHDLPVDKSKQHDGEVNGRPAIQVKDMVGTGGQCQVGIEVAPKARALVTVTLGSSRDTDQACEQASSIAQAVEPQLPKGK